MFYLVFLICSKYLYFTFFCINVNHKYYVTYTICLISSVLVSIFSPQILFKSFHHHLQLFSLLWVISQVSPSLPILPHFLFLFLCFLISSGLPIFGHPISHLASYNFFSSFLFFLLHSPVHMGLLAYWCVNFIQW